MLAITSDKIQSTIHGIRAEHDTLDFEEVAQCIVNLFWDLYEVRPDIEELATWVAHEEKNILSYGREIDQRSIGLNLIAFLRFIARINDCQEDVFSKIEKIGTAFDGAAYDLNLNTFANQLENWVDVLFECVGPHIRLPVTMENDQIRIGRHCKVSFNRTLRIPEDGNDYPLPASFGRLPICRVEEYAEKVPEKWLTEGGFFIPLYQMEALFLEFEGQPWRPCVAKVAIGRINAVTGEEYDVKIRPHKQDYIVIPDQKWLDGINSGEGRVGQFVAMPLGKGYTVEAQVTDEEVHGGFQITIFDPKDDRFPSEDPRDLASRERNLAARKKPKVSMQCRPRSSDTQLLARGNHFDAQEGGTLFSGSREQKTDYFGEEIIDFGTEAVKEMGIAKGGSIKQEIVEDTYGANSWDEECRGSIVIHIVNSEVFQQITGRETPQTPISAEQYAKYEIPWFDYYDEAAPALLPAKALQHIRSIKEIDGARGGANQVSNKPIEISPDRLRKIKTPSQGERISAFLKRAQSSLAVERYQIAVRETTYAIDLLRKKATGATIINNENDSDLQRALEIRAEANLALGRFLDAEGDASDCLESDEGSLQALSTRARALIGMEEHEMAIADANLLLQRNASDMVGLLVLAEGYLASGLYDLAIENSSTALRLNSKVSAAYRVRAIAHLRKGKHAEAMQDATAALIYGESDLSALLARAEAFLKLGNPYDARQDIEDVLRADAGNKIAKDLLSKVPKMKKKRHI